MAAEASRNRSGLVKKDGGTELPLKSVSVEAHTRGFVVGLQSTLTYCNDSSDPVEVLFRFPLEKTHAVISLTAVIDGRRITAQLREKEEARRRYDDAIASGLSAALGEEKSGDIFSIALGNLPPGKDAQIHLQLVGELSVDAEGAVRFSLPSTLKPRYTPSGSTDPLAPVSDPGDGQQVERGSVSAVSWFHLTVEGRETVAEVTSPTHSIAVTSNAPSNQLGVHISQKLDQDLIILVKYKSPYTPMSFVEPGAGKEGSGGYMGGTAVMVNFFPTFPSMEAACEFIFLVDRSGSMSGSYIRSARETLVFFLKSLPEGSFFNIIGFGSSHVKLFPSSVSYNREHLEKAITHTQSMKADLGGTELLSPLQYVFGCPCVSGYSRQLFVLTDGSVSNTDACVRVVHANINTTRCFTFGIGTGASSALVEGLAKAGNGTAEFVKQGERMQPKVIRSLKRALQPALTDVSVKFKVPSKCDIVQSPQNIPPIFNGEKLVAYAVIQSKAPLKETKCTAVLKANLLGAKQKFKVPFVLNSSATPSPSLLAIHHLAAKALLTDWEVEEGREKKSIVDLSIESNVICSHTAFIAVDEETSEPVGGAMKTYDLKAKGYDEWSNYSSSDSDDEVGLEDFDEEEEEGMEEELLCVKGADISTNELCEGELEYELESWSEGEGQKRVLQQRRKKVAATIALDRKSGLADLTTLITAQQHNGSWNMDSSLTQLIGKPLLELEAGCPLGKECVTVWATVLAVSLLRLRYFNQQDEWELIAMKAESWLKRQSLPPGVTLDTLYQDAQKVLK